MRVHLSLYLHSFDDDQTFVVLGELARLDEQFPHFTGGLGAQGFARREEKGSCLAS